MTKTEIENKIYDLKRTVESCKNISLETACKVCEILNKEIENA